MPTQNVKSPDGKEFAICIDQEVIAKRIQKLGAEISKDYHGKDLLFLVILNGAFVFAADLLRTLSVPSEVSFIRLASYQGFNQNDEITTLIGISEPIEGRDIVIIEDIIDSGNTIIHFLEDLQNYKPKSIEIASLLVKPESMSPKLNCKYTGFEIGEEFVIGFGMDYSGFGRQLPHLFQLKK